MKQIILFGLTVTLLFTLSTNYVSAASLPKATCGDTSLVITNLPADDRKVAVRINDQGNGWNLDKPYEGDMAGIITPDDGKFTFKAQGKHTYDWWVHVENPDGTFGSAIGGEVYCGAGAPSSLSVSCKNNKVSLSWNKVASADHYAVRVDDASNPWNPADPQDGDRSDNNVKETKFSSSGSTGRGYNVWVHSVDSKGIFSPAKEAFVSCRVGSSSGNIFGAISAWFANLFK
jgi:hypothetical protein